MIHKLLHVAGWCLSTAIIFLMLASTCIMAAVVGKLLGASGFQQGAVVVLTALGIPALIAKLP